MKQVLPRKKTPAGRRVTQPRFEMLYRDDIPPVVSINEAIELAKTFGGAESGGFVNGILDRVRKDLTRPAREAVSSSPKEGQD